MVFKQYIEIKTAHYSSILELTKADSNNRLVIAINVIFSRCEARPKDVKAYVIIMIMMMIVRFVI